MIPAEKFRRRQHGFTFVELLATVVLIAAILPVAMHGIALCTRLSGQTRRELEAASLARSKLTELVVSGEALSGAGGGAFDEPWTAYEWKSELLAWEDGSLQELKVTITWSGQSLDQSLSMSTLVAPEEE